jgi:putative endonuclease
MAGRPAFSQKKRLWSGERAKAARRSLGEGGLLQMMYVYLLQSIPNPVEYYVGSSIDIDARLVAHNGGKSPHTAKHRPWRLLVAMRFEDDDRARAFERYLKTGSGRAFAIRHFR